MPLLPAQPLLLFGRLRNWKLTEDLRFTRAVGCMARFREGDAKSSVFRQPTVSQVALQEQTEWESHASAEKLSWQPKKPQTKWPDPVFDAPSEKVHSVGRSCILWREHEIERLRGTARLHRTS